MDRLVRLTLLLPVRALIRQVKAGVSAESWLLLAITWGAALLNLIVR